MPAFDVWSEDVHKPGYIVNANNDLEAIGRARERWNLPDDLMLIPVLRCEDDRTEKTVNLTELLHRTATQIFIAWNQANVNNESTEALEAAYSRVAEAYGILQREAVKLDQDRQNERRKETQTFSVYSKKGRPTKRPA